MEASLGRAAVPAWSGVFWESEGFGYMSVHITDERTHRPPSNWKFVRTYAVPEDESQVFEYRKVCSDWPCSLRLLDSA